MLSIAHNLTKNRAFLGNLQRILKCSSVHVRILNGPINDKNGRIKPIGVREYSHIQREYKAFVKLLNRSELFKPNQLFETSVQTRQNHQNPPNQDKGPKKDDEDKNKYSSLVTKAFIWVMTAYLLIAFATLFLPSENRSEINRYISWNEFLYQMLAKGEVDEVIIRPDVEVVTIILHDGAIIRGKRAEHKVYHMNVSSPQRFEDRLREAENKLGIKDGVTITYERRTETFMKLFVPLVIAGVIIALLSRGRNMKSPINTDMFSSFTKAKFTLVHPLFKMGKSVRFADVAGLKEAKIEMNEVVDYLKRPQHYKRLGAKVPRGVLLLGPPGCGKTLLAKAVATESNMPFLSMNGSEFIEMIGGLGAARVRDLFKEARDRAPCIIYIDEIDAIGRKRSASGGGMASNNSESEQTLNQLLVEMDGMASKEGVILLSSTNRADVLDKALLRPGRFDRHILIDLPTLEERREIFETHLSHITLKKPVTSYSERLAYLTPGFSGADIANVCNEAALYAARFKKRVVDDADLEYAVERLVGGTEKRNHAISPTEKRVVAYHEAGHALVGWLLEHTDALLKVTIVPRTSMALGFAQVTPSDQKLFTKQQLFERMCMALGGRVAELLTFERVTTGAQNDLEKVTKMAYAQTMQYGMCPEIGLMAFDDEQLDVKQGRRPFSKKLQATFDMEARRMVAEAFHKTKAILEENGDKLKLLAEELLKRETLNYGDVVQLIGPPPFGAKKQVEFLEIPEVTPTDPASPLDMGKDDVKIDK